MHFVNARSILSSDNGMNLFRGCTHGCIYCDSRSLCYRIEHDFEDVEIKRNAPQLLADALRRKRSKCMVSTGSMTDPYIPHPEARALTRQALTIIRDMGFGLAIQTKSDLILQDLDLLRDIHNRAKCVVQITLTTFDDALCSILEPNVCPTSRRIEVLHTLQKEGIPTVVWLCPILPFINDTPENIRAITQACADAGVYGIIHFGMGMTLREGSREYFYRKLDQHFPGLKQKYVRRYGLRYELPSPNAPQLERIFSDICSAAGMVQDADALFAYLHRLREDEVQVEQMRLF